MLPMTFPGIAFFRDKWGQKGGWWGWFFLDDGIPITGINSLMAFSEKTSRVFTWSKF